MNENNKNNKLGEILANILVITLVACATAIVVGITIKFLNFIF